MEASLRTTPEVVAQLSPSHDGRPKNETPRMVPGDRTPAEMKRAELIERPGGHHFDGNYDALAARILERLTINPRMLVGVFP
jgi:hypothetical protein